MNDRDGAKRSDKYEQPAGEILMPTSTELQSEIVQLIQRDRIRNRIQAYARGVDRRQWDLVADAYHHDAYDNHGGYQGGVLGLIQWLKRRHESIEQSMHFIGNCLIDFTSESTAIAESYCVVYQRYAKEAEETIRIWVGDGEIADDARISVELVCRYVDCFERRGADWRIAHRTVVMEAVKAASDSSPLPAGWAVSRRDDADVLWEKLGLSG